MLNAIINFSSSRVTDSELITKTAAIEAGMKNNNYFPEPRPSLEEIAIARLAYASALSACSSGARQATAIKNGKRKELEVLLRKLGNYVNAIANGNEEQLLSSGFDISKPSEAVGPLPAPQNIQIKPGRSKGTVVVSCDRVEHASHYVLVYRNMTEGEQSEKELAFSTKPKLWIGNLTSGNQYSFCLLALGTHEERNWSDEVRSFVL